jgi:urate oxidase
VAKLLQNSYGKSKVRLTKVTRAAAHHDLAEISVDVELKGDFTDSYTAGDNRKIIATDSMKNTVYVLAKENNFTSIEDFAAILCRHFVSTYAQVHAASAMIHETKWKRIKLEGSDHPHAFVFGGTEMRTCTVNLVRDDRTVILYGGIESLQVLKTSASEFSDFVTDRYRTLKDAKDRIFATTIEAKWNYYPDATDFNQYFTDIRAALLKTFATHHSLAVQQTLLAMGEAALAACPKIDLIDLKMPNQHRIPFNFQPFGLENNNEIFVPTDEPFGLITGTVKRQ